MTIDAAKFYFLCRLLKEKILGYNEYFIHTFLKKRVLVY